MWPAPCGQNWSLSILLDEGVAPEELKRVHSPAGLDFAGTTPEEIALSIVGELVTIRHGGSGKSMMELK